MIQWIKYGVIAVLLIAVLIFLVFVLKCYWQANKKLQETPILKFYDKVKNADNYCALADISPNIKNVVVALEDKNFWKHSGFDICKIIQAMIVDIKCRQKKLGGSTITQQLAKNMYFSFDKTYTRKVAEIFVARRLEKELTKQEILEIYLNIIYYGQGQYNIKDACEFYFKKAPSEVSLNQAITLGCLLPAPTAYNPLNPNGYFEKAKKMALVRLCKRGMIKEDEIEGFICAGYNEELQTDITIENMTVREKVCQMLMVMPEDLVGPTVTESSDSLKEALKEYPVSGFLFKAYNMQSQKQIFELIKDMQSYSKISLLIACDEEGGRVNRLMKKVGTTYIGPMFDYKDDGCEKAYENAYTIASDMQGLGFNLNFAPVADVWSNPKNTVISDRAYSDNFEQAAELVAAAVKGFHDGGVATTLKHFPGHGDTLEDSHHSSAYVKKTLEEIKNKELLPFVSGIEAGSDLVMLGHLSLLELSSEPILFSHEIVTGLLRDDLGFEGVIITDSLEMAAVSEHYSLKDILIRSMNAGVDILLCPGEIDECVTIIEEAIKVGTISESRIDESVLRILELKKRIKTF